MPQSDRERLPYVLLWEFIFVVVLFAAAQPVSIQTQFFISGTLLLCMALIKIGKPDKTWRTIFIFLAGFIVLRYALWRTTNTLPELTDLLSFVPGILVYIAELYAIFMFFLSTFVVIDPIDREEAPLPKTGESLPSIDVFVPSYNEEEELLEVTLLAAREMNYPGKLTVYLLDDGGTDQKRNDPDPDKARKALERHESLKALCNRLSGNTVPIKYITRAKNEHAKAGNMNAALEHTDGELILILDADHVPTVNFLDRTVGYFLRDPKLFLVQTPHFFITPDPLEKNLDTFNKMPSENEMFYRVIQKGLDKWNAAFFCGSAALLRRRYLEEVDGFSGESITEDAETALELHSRGYNSIYVAEPLIAGLHPETFSAFIGQRSRWSQGMMQIFLLKNPLFKNGLKLHQRLSYTSSSMFWLFPFARLAFLLAPLFYLFFGLEIYQASAAEFIGYTMTYMIATLMVQNFLYGNVRWPLISELYEYVQSLFTARAILKVFINPRAPTFNVTAKGETLSQHYVSPLFKPFLIVFLLLLAGLIAAIWRYHAYPDTQDIVLVVATWNVFNLMLAMSALGVVCELRQVRAAPRMRIRRQAEVWVGNQSVRASVEDISATGAQILVPYELGNTLFREHKRRTDANGEPVTEQGSIAVLRVLPGEYTQSHDPDRPPDDVTFEVRNIRPTEGNLSLGVRFIPQSVDEATAAVRMMFAESRHWQEFQNSRSNAPGAFNGTISFFANSFRYGWTAATFFWNHYQESKQGAPPHLEGHAGPPLPVEPPQVPQPANESQPAPAVAEIDAAGRRRYPPPASAVAMAGGAAVAGSAALAVSDLPQPTARGPGGGTGSPADAGGTGIATVQAGSGGRPGWRLRRRARPGEPPAGFNADHLTARGDRALREAGRPEAADPSAAPRAEPGDRSVTRRRPEPAIGAGAPTTARDPGPEPKSAPGKAATPSATVTVIPTAGRRPDRTGPAAGTVSIRPVSAGGDRAQPVQPRQPRAEAPARPARRGAAVVPLGTPGTAAGSAPPPTRAAGPAPSAPTQPGGPAKIGVPTRPASRAAAVAQDRPPKAAAAAAKPRRGAKAGAAPVPSKPAPAEGRGPIQPRRGGFGLLADDEPSLSFDGPSSASAPAPIPDGRRSPPPPTGGEAVDRAKPRSAPSPARSAPAAQAAGAAGGRTGTPAGAATATPPQPVQRQPAPNRPAAAAPTAPVQVRPAPPDRHPAPAPSPAGSVTVKPADGRMAATGTGPGGPLARTGGPALTVRPTPPTARQARATLRPAGPASETARPQGGDAGGNRPAAEPTTTRPSTASPSRRSSATQPSPAAADTAPARTPRLSIGPVGVQSRGTGRRLTRGSATQRDTAKGGSEE